MTRIKYQVSLQMMDDFIPSLITDDVNNLLTRLPTPTEIHHDMLAMNKDGASGPDGYGASFSQTYWEIVKNDVIIAVLDLFTRDWILSNFNAT